MTQPQIDFATLAEVLHKRARQLRSCPQEAADLAQDAALRVWQQHRGGARIDNLRAYGLVALANLARSRWRSRTVWVELLDDTASTPPDAPRRIACAQLQAALRRLPPDQARLMALVAGGETSPARLARLTDTPLGTVMSRLARARARLRTDLGLGKTTPSAALYADPGDA